MKIIVFLSILFHHNKKTHFLSLARYVYSYIFDSIAILLLKSRLKLKLQFIYKRIYGIYIPNLPNFKNVAFDHTFAIGVVQSIYPIYPTGEIWVNRLQCQIYKFLKVLFQ
jgi:undecaprenyl pyrophosphate phosphatase UppP